MNLHLKLQQTFLLAKSSCPVAVVIPIYKSVLSRHEAIALDRGLKVLNQHPLKIIAPEGLLLDHPRLETVEIEFLKQSIFKEEKGITD